MRPHAGKIKRLFLCLLLAAAICVPGCGAQASVSAADAGFSFIFMSDTQADPEAGDYSALGVLLDKALAHESAPRLLLLGGDNVNDGSSANEWDDFWAAADGRLDDITVASAAGNHDSSPLLAGQFDYPETAPEASADGFFYTFSKGNVFFLMLDSNIMGGGGAAHAEWLADQLASDAARSAAWRVAVSHHPMWPVAEIPKDAQRAQTMRDVFLPLMEAGGIDLLLCGHQHVYARTAPVAGEGFVQIMAASGAKDSYIAGDPGYIAEAAGAPNYIIVEAGADVMRITAFDGGGKAFDSLQISGGKGK